MKTNLDLPAGVEIAGPLSPRHEEVLTREALALAATLHRAFDGRRGELLARRREVQRAISNGQRPDFPEATRHVREGDWTVGPVPEDLQDRRVEITGPVERKMMINALNSGANVFMADFEDANSPTWENVVQGQVNLLDATRRTLELDTGAKRYTLGEKLATLVVRARGWHLDEVHVLVDGTPVSGAIFDVALYLANNARELLARGTGPYLYLPKLENHLEARLWNDVLDRAEDELGLDAGTVKVTVLIETVLAALEMDEILYELRDHIVALNAGRWDYIFSIIKKFRHGDSAAAVTVLPDRGQVTMTVPFMRAYTDLLVRTCHRRGAHAIGGMAAFIPTKKDEEANRLAFEKVREDKRREAADGFDGTWVAHPALVPVAREEFDRVLGQRPHQKDRLREDVKVTADDLLDFRVPGGTITEEGLRNNISVGIQYIGSWLQGIGAAAIFNLMEDAATAEISRSQLWQWLHVDEARLADGRPVDEKLYRRLLKEELDKIRAASDGSDGATGGHIDVAARLMDDLVASEDYPEFLTLVAYEHLDR